MIIRFLAALLFAGGVFITYDQLKRHGVLDRMKQSSAVQQAGQPVAAPQPEPIPPNAPYLVVTWGALPGHLSRADGRNTVTIFYRTVCPNSAAMMPGIGRLASEYGDRLDFQAISLDPPPNAMDIPGFLRNHEARFTPYWLQWDWSNPDLRPILAAAGAKVSEDWVLPLIILRDGKGKVRAWEGYSELEEFSEALRKVT